MTIDIRPLSPVEVDAASGGNAALGVVVGWFAGKVLDAVTDAVAEPPLAEGETYGGRWTAKVKRAFGLR